MTTLTRDERVAEYIRCKQSFPYFLRYVRIEDANKGVIPLELWPHTVDIAETWQTGESHIEGKARQLGYSWELAAYDVWLMHFRNNARILSISIGERESKELLGKVDFVEKNLPTWMQLQRYKDNATEIGFLKTQSSIIALPSTKSAGRGEQATLVQTDEWAFHEYAGENYASYRAAIADGGQHIAVTTGNGPAGMFASFWETDVLDMPYRKRFNGWRSRPDRDDAWYERERKAYEAAGEKHHLMFVRENPETVEEMFTAFYGLVYDMFTDKQHAIEDPFTYEDAKWRVAAVDPGQGDPAAISIIGESEGTKDHPAHAHDFGDEFYQQGVTTIDDIWNYLDGWYQKAPLHAVVVDGTEGTLISSLNTRFRKKYGQRAGIVQPANKERGVGIGHVASRLSAGTFTTNRKNKHIIREFHSYRWAQRRASGEADPYTTSTPTDHHGDRLDTVRYGLVFLSQYCSNVRTLEVDRPTYDPAPVEDEMPMPDFDGKWTDPMSKRLAIPEGQRPPVATTRAGPDYRRRTKQPTMGRR